MSEHPLILSLAGVPDETRFGLLRDLQRSLKDIGLRPKPVAAEIQRGTRGDLSLFGQIGLDLVQGGAVAGLLACLKAYLAREPKLSFEIKNKNGSSVKFNAQNVSEANVVALVRQITVDEG